jgi:heme oxygenase
MPSPRHDVPRSLDGDRWPPLLLDLRRTARPDRARVAAYQGLTQSPAGWAAYTEFLAVHRAWIASLDRALAAAGLVTRWPLPDAAEEFDRDLAQTPGEAATHCLLPPRTRAHALGYLYVVEAFRLGCSVLARWFRGQAEPLADPARPEQTTRGSPWGDLVKVLRGVPPEEHAAVIQGAREAFSAWEERLATSLAHFGLGPLSTDAHAA